MGKIYDVVSTISNLGSLLGDIQSEKLPTVRFGKFLTRMFYHCFKRHKLQDGANGILDVWHAVPEDTNCLFQLLRVGVRHVRISDLWPVKDASKGLLRDGDLLSRHAVSHKEAKPSRKDGPFKLTSKEPVPEGYEIAHAVYAFALYIQTAPSMVMAQPDAPKRHFGCTMIFPVMFG